MIFGIIEIVAAIASSRNKNKLYFGGYVSDSVRYPESIAEVARPLSFKL